MEKMRKDPNWAKALKPKSIKADFSTTGLYPIDKRAMDLKLGADQVYVRNKVPEAEDEVASPDLQSPMPNFFSHLGNPPIMSPIPNLFSQLPQVDPPPPSLLLQPGLSQIQSPLIDVGLGSFAAKLITTVPIDEDRQDITQSLSQLSLAEEELVILETQGISPTSLVYKTSRSANNTKSFLC